MAAGCVLVLPKWGCLTTSAAEGSPPTRTHPQGPGYLLFLVLTCHVAPPHTVQEGTCPDGQAWMKVLTLLECACTR